ncbi:flagellar filament capping protein FliD [Sulfurimonas sp.]|nr:flagellar filament capping protein FliD [Sulfurimonas sp.]
MAGVNSLGIGSGVLTADVLDQLREADDSVILAPLEAKLELSTQKEDAYKLLDGFMSTFKQSTATLGGENMYLGRQTSGSDDFVSVSAKSGADVQSFNITEVVKAEKDVWNSSAIFSNTTSAIPALGSGTLNINVDGEDLEIDYTSTTTLDDIRLAINESLTFGATATNLKIGEDSYTFSLSADELNEAITLTDSQKKEQIDKITLSGDAKTDDIFTWSDGTVSIDIPLVDGENEEETATRIAAAINLDAGGDLGGAYTATASSDGFTIQLSGIAADADPTGTKFTSTASIAGTSTEQTVVQETISTGFTKQLNTVSLSDTSGADDVFTWSDGTFEVSFALSAGNTAAQSADEIETEFLAALAADSDFNDAYSFAKTADGFTVESKSFGLDFNATTTIAGTTPQTLTSEITTNATSNLENQLGFDETDVDGNLVANIQEAREASFKFNGIAITRSTNTIDDLVNGATISLNKNHGATDSTSINVTQNNDTITTEMELFVTNYNTLSSNLKDMTIYDQDTGQAGIFNSETFIKSINSQLKSIVTSSDSSGNSLYSYGISIDTDGVMSLDSSTFSAKLTEDASALEELFRGAAATTTLYKQQNTVSLTGNAVDGDTFTWDDGSNGVTVNLVAGETPEQTGARIAAAINADSVLKHLYTAVETSTGFTIESKTAGISFSGSSVSTGSQSSREVTTTVASKTANDEKIGIFQQLDIKMQSYMGSNQLLSNFNDKLNNEKTSTIAEYDKQKSALDVRYETMTKKFAAYDAVINKLNNQFASLKSMIEAEYDSDS